MLFCRGVTHGVRAYGGFKRFHIQKWLSEGNFRIPMKSRAEKALTTIFLRLGSGELAILTLCDHVGPLSATLNLCDVGAAPKC